MTDDTDLSARLKALDASLAANTPQKPVDALAGAVDPAALKASRMGLELAVAILGGVGLGYLGDKALGTLPLLMILGSLLGFGAGVLNAWRALNGKFSRVGFDADKK